MLKNIVFLTGAAGSLGSATAKRLVQEGCKVTLFDLPDSNGKELEASLGSSVVFAPGDVTSEKDVNDALNLTKEKFGNVNTVVNCAAVHRALEVYNINKKTSVDLDAFERVMKVNVTGTFNVLRLSMPYLNENPVNEGDLRGLVINTSGFGTQDGQKGQSLMAAAWGAIEGMTVPLCREFGERGVRVMTIAPGLIQSNLTSFLPSKIMKSFVALTPSPKRLGRPDEYAELVVAIMRNEYLNGEVIRLNGGFRLLL